VKERVRRTVERVRTRSPAADLGITLIGRPNYAQDTLLTSYIAMRLFVMLFPLAYMFVAGIGLYANHFAAGSADAARDAGLSGALASSVAQATQGPSKGHAVVFVSGLALSVWAGRSAVRALRVAHASVWRVPVPRRPIAELGGPATAAVLLVVSWLGVLLTRLRDAGAPIGLTSVALAAAVGAIWLEASWHLPNAVNARRDLLPGAAVVAIGAPLLNFATQVYFVPKLGRATEMYGALGASLVVLTFLLVVAWTIVVGAELNAGVAEWRRRREQRSHAHAAAGDRASPPERESPGVG
jgi:membrane protein